jgi:pimeloyl-ACP methyl ester carboxylesterase
VHTVRTVLLELVSPIFNVALAAATIMMVLQRMPRLIGCLLLLWPAWTGATASWPDLLRQALADAAPRRRSLQETADWEIPACGEVLATLTTHEVRVLLEDLITDNLNLSQTELLVFRVGLVPELDFGVKVVKICGKCSDFAETANLYEGVCQAEDYASDVIHSGLLMLPLERDSSSQIASGTRPVTILCHGTEASNLSVPSNLWNSTDPDGLVLFGTLFTSLSGTVTILPDYTGYGESRDSVFRAYVVRQAYATATLPLLWESERMVLEESNCQSAVGDAFMVVGYSEGGYAAVALADVLHHQLNKTIIQVRAGGAPLKLSTVQLQFLVQQVLQDTFDSRRRYYIALLGAAYSTTTTDVANYNESQDLMARDLRTEVLNAMQAGSERSSINEVVPIDNPLSILDANIIATFQRALANGEEDPCVTSVVEGETDLLCRALQAQDLIQVVEETPYPIALCHSPGDTLVSFGNLPDVSVNKLLNIEQVSGGHESAALDCFLQSILFYREDGKVQDFPLEDKTLTGGCLSNQATTKDEDVAATVSGASLGRPTLGLGVLLLSLFASFI